MIAAMAQSLRLLWQDVFWSYLVKGTHPKYTAPVVEKAKVATRLDHAMLRYFLVRDVHCFHDGIGDEGCFAYITTPHPSGWRRRWRCSWPKRRRAAGRTSSRRLCWNFLMHSSLLADYWNCLCFARDSHQSMSIAMHLHHRNAESSWGRILRSLGHLVFRALLSLFKGTHYLYNSPKVSSWLSEGILTVVVGICWKPRIRMPRRIWKVVPRISLVAAEAAAHGCLDDIYTDTYLVLGHSNIHSPLVMRPSSAIHTLSMVNTAVVRTAIAHHALRVDGCIRDLADPSTAEHVVYVMAMHA